jgi:hypothetical protein
MRGSAVRFSEVGCRVNRCWCGSSGRPHRPITASEATPFFGRLSQAMMEAYVVELPLPIAVAG